MKDNNRILWLDGIKGIACIFIFLHHFFVHYFPAVYYGSLELSKAKGIDIYLSQSPIGFFLNGNFFVHLFLIISGYVITCTVYRGGAKSRTFHYKTLVKIIISDFLLWNVHIDNSFV